MLCLDEQFLLFEDARWKKNRPKKNMSTRTSRYGDITIAIVYFLNLKEKKMIKKKVIKVSQGRSGAVVAEIFFDRRKKLAGRCKLAIPRHAFGVRTFKHFSVISGFPLSPSPINYILGHCSLSHPSICSKS